MANVMQCDRCKAIFEIDDSYMEIKAVSSENEILSFDLCLGCEKEFIESMKNKKEDS